MASPASTTSDARITQVLRPLAQRRTWVRASLRLLVIALLPVGVSLIASEPLLAGYFALWLLILLIPSSLIEAVLARTKSLSAPFPLAWALFFANGVLCLAGALQVIYLMQDGSRAGAGAALIRVLQEAPKQSFLLSAFFAISLAVAGSFAQRKPAWREERLGVGSFFLLAYLLIMTVQLGDKVRDETALLVSVAGWGVSLAILSSLFCLAYALVDFLERRILGAPELDNLTDYLRDRMEERGPLGLPRAETRERGAEGESEREGRA